MFVSLNGVTNSLSDYICIMTPEKRLNQLEPIMAEVSAQVDRVTAQNRQLITTVTQQSDDIQFLLRETSVIKQDVSEIKEDMSEVKLRIVGLEAGQAKLEAGQAKLEAGQAKLEAGQAEMKQSLDMILQLLKSGNGRS